MTEWFYNPLKGQPRYVDVYRLRSLAASEWVSTCVMTILEEVAQIPWEIVPKDEKLRESPPEDIQAEIDEVNYLLNNPNDNKGETINTIFYAAIRDSLEIDAFNIVKGFSLNSYVQHPAGGFELKPRGQRQLVELFARDGGSFLKETDVNGIEYRYWQYSYLHPAVAPIEFDVNEVIYGMRYPRSYSVYGWGEIQSMETVLNSLINSAFTNATMFQEYSVPSGVISFTGSEEDEARLREYFRTEIKGRFHKVAVLNKEAKFTPLTYTNRDLEFIQGQQWFAKLVWAMFKLTPSEVGFTDDIRATGQALSAQGTIQKRKAILPILRRLEQWMNNQIINEISDRIVLAFKYVDKEQEMAEDQLDMQKLDRALLTPNEWRAKKKVTGPSTWYNQYGEQPFPFTLAQMKSPGGMAGHGGGFSTPPPSAPKSPEALQPKIPLTAEGQAYTEAVKAWGGIPNIGYDFDPGSLASNDLIPAPALIRDGRTGQVKVLPVPTQTLPGKRYITRNGEIFTAPIKTTQPKPKNPQQTKVIARSSSRPSPETRGFGDRAEAVLKQYMKPTREPFIGPYEADRKPMPKFPSMVGGNPHEQIRDGMLLPGENPSEVRRSRDAVGPQAGRPKARRSLAKDHDYPMGSLGYRPDEPVARGDVGEKQTAAQIYQGRVDRDYVRPGKPFGPMEHSQAHRTGPKETYRGGPGNIRFPRRQGGRIRKIGHPSLDEGPQSTGHMWRGQKRTEKSDLHKGGAGVHKWERDETNVPIAMAGEEPGQTHVDPHLLKKPYPGRHRGVTGGGGYDVESRIAPTRAGTPKIIDASIPHDDRVKAYVKYNLPKEALNVDNVWSTHDKATDKMSEYLREFKKERKEHPKEKAETIWRIVQDHMRKKIYPRTTQPDDSPTAPLAQPRENIDFAGGAGTEQSPRIRITPTIRRGPKYPRDVPPIQPDTVREQEGGSGAMRSTAPSGAKYVLRDRRGAPPPAPGEIDTHTTSLGPDHRETLGYVERDLSKIRDGVKRSMWARRKAAIQEFGGARTYMFDNKGREQFASKMVKAGYVELKNFANADLMKGHWCATCPAMITAKQSPTGYACQKFKFPDRPFGCCDGWYPKSGLKQVNAYTYREQWKGGRLEPRLVRAPKKREIQQATEKKTVGPRHTHAPVFRGGVTAERGCARKLIRLMKDYRAGKITKNAARREGLKAIDENIAQCREIAQRHTRRISGKDILAPAVARRLKLWRKTTFEDFDATLSDAK